MIRRKLLKNIISVVLTLVLVTMVVGSASALTLIPLTGPFDDVSIFHPAVKAIQWLKDNKISLGYPDGTFRPDTNVKREEMANFLYREAGTLVAAGAHIVPKSGGGFEIDEWFNNVNGTKPTLTPEGFMGFAHGIDFDFNLEDKFMMCSIDSSDSVVSICSINKGTTKILVTVWDTDAKFVGTAGFWVLVYGNDIQP